LTPAVSAQTPKSILFKNGFSSPIYLTAPVNDINRVFVVERAGRIKIIKDILTNPTTNAALFLDISTLTTVSGERGLFSMAFDPNYASTGRFYVYYTNSVGSLVLARYTVSGNPDVANPGGEILLTIPHPGQSNHNGGQVAFGPDGYLYMATGDGGGSNDTSNNAQNLNSHLGKVLRFDVSTPTGYAIPPTNPYAGSPSGLPEIWAVGTRNPFRFSFDRNTGDMYIGDVGQGAREEVDFQSASFTPTPNAPINYGWRCLEGNNQTNLGGCTYPNPYPGGDVRPIWEYTHGVGICITGGFMYRGAMIPDLRGYYWFADYSFSKIWTFRYMGTGVVNSSQERTAQLAPGGGLSITSIASFGQDALGEIYILDLSGGEIFKIVPTTPNIKGISSYGSGTPGCNGSQVMSAMSTAVINHPAFILQATNCPPATLGLGIITDKPDVVGSDPFAIGVTLHVDLFLSSTVIALDMVSDPNGTGTILAPIPNVPQLVGLHFYAQGLSAWASCSLPPNNLSTTNGLDFTIF
jgi:glucose/arabinose dehydrogenase